MGTISNIDTTSNGGKHFHFNFFLNYYSDALNPIFCIVSAANMQEAFLVIILITALGMSFLTEGMGLINKGRMCAFLR